MLSDIALLVFAFGIGHRLWYHDQLGGEVLRSDLEPFSAFTPVIILFLLATGTALLARGVYSRARFTSMWDQLGTVVGGVISGVAATLLLAYLLDPEISRLLMLYTLAASVGLLVGKRLAVECVRRECWRREIGVHRVLVVGGANDAGRRLMQVIANDSSLYSTLVGYVDDSPPPGKHQIPIATERRVISTRRLGSATELPIVLRESDIDEVIVALTDPDAMSIRTIVDQCRKAGVDVLVAPEVNQRSTDRIAIRQVAGVPLFAFQTSRITGAARQAKRTLDIAMSLLVLSVMAIPLAMIACSIRRDSPGPILCRQQRIGRDDREFTVFKFRTMDADADARRDEIMAGGCYGDPRLRKCPDDPRRTRVGRFLRRWSLDELPQYWNILRGDMSVVGPRPQLPDEVALYEQWHRQRLLVTPGLTGLWQVNGRSNLSFDEMVRLDLYYAEHWSPWLDVKIMLRTVPAVITGRGAY